MSKELNYVLLALKRLYRSVLSLREDVNTEETIAGIKKDITFRGPSAWILIFSILIASIGLNINSIPVIIGAMLISPLMGPIVGIGLAVGTNDYELIVRSMRNLGIAISIALITSTLYFLATPLNIEQTELLTRTKPTILDVLIGFFGGFAGIIAGSRREKSNVVPGVAIATALMPPLCTAGYGLATLKMNYFFGAFYLFFINSVFISIATFIVVRYMLRFPIVEFIDSAKLRRYKLYFGIFIILTIAPSTVIFYQVIQEARFKILSEQFVSEKCTFPGSELLSYKIRYADSLSQIDLYYIGDEITEEKRFYLNDKLLDYGLTANTMLPITKAVKLNIHQQVQEKIDIEGKLTELNNNLRIKILEDIYTKNEEQVRNRDLKIKLLENRIIQLTPKDTIPYVQIDRELKYHFPAIERFAYARSVRYTSLVDTAVYDTIPVFMLEMLRPKDDYKKTLPAVTKWLRLRLQNPHIRVLMNDSENSPKPPN
jgi:uncharacterized hydrophobic protein (TIGR00271 family)